MDSRRTDTDTALHFMQEAVTIAPVVYVPDNHEARITEYGALRDGMPAAGAAILEDAAMTLSRGENP